VPILLSSGGVAAELSSEQSQADPKYLLFQLSDVNPQIGSRMASTYTKADLEKAVDDIVTAIGQRGNHANQQLGFTVGPLTFDLTDDQLRSHIANAFAVAEEKDVAAAFHIDDSMFWNRRRDLWSDKNNIEWSDWQGTIVPHRSIGWAGGGAPILAPPMCYNSPAIKAEAARVARDVIGPAVKKGIDHFNAIGKAYLFAGVIAGWETRMQDDSALNGLLGVHYGYCALRYLGYTSQNLPADIDIALQGVVSDWVTLWTQSLVQGGVPKDHVYTHIALPGEAPRVPASKLSELIRVFYKHSSPVVTAFNQYSRPGFSVYGADKIRVLYDVLAAHAATPWAISEGANYDMPDSNQSRVTTGAFSMEQYLGRAFNHGAACVNLFVNLSHADDRVESKAGGGPGAIAGYRKFLSGGQLRE
jgi:hypothetical protein